MDRRPKLGAREGRKQVSTRLPIEWAPASVQMLKALLDSFWRPPSKCSFCTGASRKLWVEILPNYDAVVVVTNANHCLCRFLLHFFKPSSASKRSYSSLSLLCQLWASLFARNTRQCCCCYRRVFSRKQQQLLLTSSPQPTHLNAGKQFV